MNRYFIFISFICYQSMLLGTVGALDSTFGTSGIVTTAVGSTGSNFSASCALQPDSKIVAVGNANPGIAVARYTEQGVLDTTFNSSGSKPGTLITTQFGGVGSSALGRSVAIQNDGKIVVCGSITISSVVQFAIIRYMPDGSLDTTFNSTGYNSTTITGGTSQIAFGITIDTSGNIVICGSAVISSVQNFVVLRYTSAGVLDNTFGPGVSGSRPGYVTTTISGGTIQTAYGIVLDSSRNIVVCGAVTISGVQQFAVLRYTSAGVLDTNFNTNGYVTTTISGGTVQAAYGVTIDSSGNIVICGAVTISSAIKLALLRYTSAGALDTGFGTSGSTTTTIGTSATGYKVAMQSNGKILVSGSNSTALFIARYTSAGLLDTTFNPSTGDNTVSVTTPGATGIIIQPNNGIVISGIPNGTFTTARFVGDAAPQGCLDVTYNSSGVTPGYITYPTDTTAANKPEVKALQALSDNTVYVLTEDLGTTTQSQLVKLNADGTTNLSAVAITQVGGIDVIVDSQQRALAIGTSGGAGWIRRSTTSTSLTADATFGTSGFVTETAHSSSFRRIGEQKAGRILVIGQQVTTANAILIAYNEAGVLADNNQASCAAFGHVSSGHPQGFIGFNSVTYYDLLIDSNDGIYIAYKDTTSIKVLKLLASGSGNDTTFGTSGSVDTGWAVGSYGNPALSFDNNGNIVVAAINSSTGDIAVKRYTPTSTTTTTGSILQATSLLSTPILTKLQCDTDNRLIFNGYDTNVFFVARCTAGTVGTLDTTFAPYSSSPGILKTTYNDNNPTDTTTPKRVSNSLCISPNGTILFAGYENITTSSTIAVVGNVVGDTNPYGQVARYPGATLTGVIDTSFGTDGTLSLLASPASLPAGTVQAMYVLSNNKILVADTNGTNTVLAQLTSAYALDTGSFGATTGKVTLTGLTNPKNIMIDTTGNVYVVGDNGSNMMLFKITSAGVVVWSINTSILTTGNVVLQQASGRIIVAGYNGTSGVIAGYNSITGALDTTFGTSGYYTTGVAAQVAAAAITSVDTIIFAYRDASANGIVNRLMPSGVVDASFSFGTALTSVSADISSQAQIKLQQDVNGKIVVVARNSTGNFIARRYLATGANDVSTVTMTLTNSSTSNLKEILSVSNGTTFILGSNTTGTTLEVARLNSVFALDTNFSYATGILQSAVSPMTNFYGIDVTSDQGILVAGASITPNPYFTRIYDDSVVTKVNQSSTALGTSGTIDTNIGTSGEVLVAGISGATSLAGLTSQVVLPTAAGQYYIAFTSGALIRLTNGFALDTTLSPLTTGFASPTSAGISSLIIDGSNRLIAAGTTGGAGWVQRYNAGLGSLDTTFNTAIATSMTTLGCVAATTIAEQTLGRYIVAGTLTGGHGALFACTNTGTIDMTFNSGGVTPGMYDTGVAAGVYAFAVDQFDRLILAYKNGANIDVIRLTSAGQLDTLFHSTGIFSHAITGADQATQVRVVLDYAGNIIVAAHTTSGISLRGLTNSGTSLYTQLDISTIITSTPVLTNLVATSDGNVLLSGYQSTTNPMWVARVTVAGILDVAFGGGDGIMTFSFDGTATTRFLGGIAMYGDGEIAIVGTETVSAVVTPFLSMAYNSPYITQVSQSPDSKAVGTNDVTLGASSATATALGITFFASSLADATSGQVARAIALQDDAHILVAVDGGLSSGSTTPSEIYLNMFTIDGTSDTTFGTNGQQTVLSIYQNQYVNDMITFNSGGVVKAIIAGYAKNTNFPLAKQNSSLVLQYILTPGSQGLDTANFGGFDGNPAGIACGDGQNIFTVGQQSSGRIIAAGLSKSNLGLLLAYTASGKLDASFGNNGYQSVGTGSTGIYTHAIDSQNRIVFAYNNAGTAVVARFLADGSGLDSSFDASASYISGVTADNNIKVAVDSSDNVYVAAGVTGNSITVKSYSNSTGNQTHTVTKTGTQLGDASAVYTMARTIVDQQGNVIVVAYDTNVLTTLVMRLTSSLALDTANFNAPNGYIAYAVGGGSTTQVATDALIHPDGRIIIVGSES